MQDEVKSKMSNCHFCFHQGNWYCMAFNNSKMAFFVTSERESCLMHNHKTANGMISVKTTADAYI